MRLHRLLVSAAAVGVVALAAPALAQPDSQRPPTESEQSRGDDSSTPPSMTAPTTPSPDSSGGGATSGSGSASGSAQSTSFTDDQLKSFLKAHDDISHLKTMGATPSNDQMAQAVSRNGLDVPTYNAIGHALRGDQALQKRLASLRSAATNPG